MATVAPHCHGFLDWNSPTGYDSVRQQTRRARLLGAKHSDRPGNIKWWWGPAFVLQELPVCSQRSGHAVHFRQPGMGAAMTGGRVTGIRRLVFIFVFAFKFSLLYTNNKTDLLFPQRWMFLFFCWLSGFDRPTLCITIADSQTRLESGQTETQDEYSFMKLNSGHASWLGLPGQNILS